MKCIGLMGGMGWEGSAAYYRVMNRAVRSRLGGFHSARIIMDSLQFQPIASASTPAEFAGVRATLVASARRLECAGAEALVIACNTVHRFADAISEASSLPLLHIADAAGAAVRSAGHRRVGLLGTRATMAGPFYRKRLMRAYGVEVVVPCAHTQAQVDRLILDELAGADGAAPLAPSCLERMDAAVAELASLDCTAVLLACTDFGVIYGGRDVSVLERALPLYDTAVLHAQAAVDFAFGGASST